MTENLPEDNIVDHERCRTAITLTDGGKEPAVSRQTGDLCQGYAGSLPVFPRLLVASFMRYP